MRKLTFILAFFLFSQAAFADIGWVKLEQEQKVRVLGGIPVWDSQKGELALWLYDHEPTDEDKEIALQGEGVSTKSNAAILTLHIPMNPRASKMESRLTGIATASVNRSQGGRTSIGGFLIGSMNSSVDSSGKDKTIYTLPGLKNLGSFLPEEGSVVRIRWALQPSFQTKSEWNLHLEAPLLLRKGR
ncbi:MAG: hypothetical protein KF760_21475 [Candidatus Eremiobacteraeota bacterium]|nr:hypothetical protein [Candidatus Eremiobacteraeota bacterium]MCW5867575.1 hypothetical protein [Candidatus Eremiobacteraeota bacterium]